MMFSFLLKVILIDIMKYLLLKSCCKADVQDFNDRVCHYLTFPMSDADFITVMKNLIAELKMTHEIANWTPNWRYSSVDEPLECLGHAAYLEIFSRMFLYIKRAREIMQEKTITFNSVSVSFKFHVLNTSQTTCQTSPPNL